MTTRRCAFIQARACPIDVDEIPLDVCRLCIDAWKTSAEIQTLTGANLLGPTITVPTGPQALQVVSPRQTGRPDFSIPSEPKSKPLTLTPNIDADTDPHETQELLYRLDNDFMMDRISADEYVEQRREIVGQLADQIDTKKPSLLAQATADGILKPEDSMPAGPPDDYFELIDLNKNRDLLQKHKVLPIMLIEIKNGKMGITKYPEDWTPPKNLNRTNLESIYDLYDELRESQEKILLQFNGTKLGILGKKNDKLLCMVLEDNDKLEDYEDQLNRITDLLASTNDFEDFLKALPEAMGKKKT
jgi:hypothetical protein